MPAPDEIGDCPYCHDIGAVTSSTVFKLVDKWFRETTVYRCVLCQPVRMHSADAVLSHIIKEL